MEASELVVPTAVVPAAPSGKDGLPVIAFPSPAGWERWLAKHHGTSKGIWLKLAKKNAGTASVTYAQALEVALRYGWIDGQKGALDEAFWVQRFTPRAPRSRWSKVNRDSALRLMEQGEMKPAGLAAVERARRDGSWERAYDAPSTASVPADLREALDLAPEAAAFFASLSGANRYAVLYRIQNAKRPETRTRLIHEFVAMLRRHETLYPQTGQRAGGKAPAARSAATVDAALTPSNSRTSAASARSRTR
jgi:uncharacterized protein YdeI (YjbR/CyaY-like superfamily)